MNNIFCVSAHRSLFIWASWKWKLIMYFSKSYYFFVNFIWNKNCFLPCHVAEKHQLMKKKKFVFVCTRLFSFFLKKIYIFFYLQSLPFSVCMNSFFLMSFHCSFPFSDINKTVLRMFYKFSVLIAISASISESVLCYYYCELACWSVKNEWRNFFVWIVEL